MKINIDKIKKLAGEAKKALATLKDFSAINKEDILRNIEKLERIKYNFIIAIQSLIDISNHLVAKKGARAPEDYGDCFKILGEMGILDASLSMRLSQMAKFRNLLVHLYWEVDDNKVCDILRENLIDIDKFLEVVGRVVRGEMEK